MVAAFNRAGQGENIAVRLSKYPASAALALRCELAPASGVIAVAGLWCRRRRMQRIRPRSTV